MPHTPPLSHTDLTRVLFGSSAFQILNAASGLGLFALLQERPGSTAEEIGSRLGLSDRPVQILLLGTTALGLTTREDDRYHNAELVTGMFRDGTWQIIEDIITFEAEIVRPVEADFTDALRENTNVGLRRLAGEGTDLYHRLAANPGMEELFYTCMRSWSRLSNPVLVAKADLTGASRVLDVGGGDGVNAIALARRHPHARFTVWDMPGAAEIARRKVAESGLADRISVAEGDIFADDYPEGHDCVLFANQMVIWSPEENMTLLRKAHRALPDGGQVIIFNAIADDTGDGPLYAALDNVYFTTLPAANSMIYHWGQYEEWLTRTGFTKVERHPGDTWTPHGAVSATKDATRETSG
jgi:L-tyrosine C(3)-methyltransferase